MALNANAMCLLSTAIIATSTSSPSSYGAAVHSCSCHDFNLNEKFVYDFFDDPNGDCVCFHPALSTTVHHCCNYYPPLVILFCIALFEGETSLTGLSSGIAPMLCLVLVPLL
ncbi:uncharacterized protein EDB91DRAFT_376798 [Suillus paluster]|uniref:uncharacterized protein n=1 Tax=Suillus paluster TaxID=48578 RepID=UPI001B86943A|nr:uncharacterized protein EDB91DRAFT_376798 [Suillus paluster]KAG1719923.1 hypothetical protein EDB91DRAFT_376798 [Suillus paluster]